MLELPRLFPESAFPTDVESQAICTIFFFCLFPHSNLKKNSPISKKSSLSPLSVLPHPLSLTLPSSLWPLSEARSLSLSLSLSKSKTTRNPSLSHSPSLVHPLSHSGHRRPPPLTLSHSGARVPATGEERAALLSLPRTCLFLTTAQKISGHRRRLTHEKRK
jgi:hypothetical protein